MTSRFQRIPTCSRRAPSSTRNAAASWIYIVGLGVDVQMQFDGGPAIIITPTMLIKQSFQQLNFQNLSAVESTNVQSIVGFGEVPQFLAQPEASTRNIPIADVVVGAGSSAQLVASGTRRMALFLRAVGGAASNLRIGDSTVAAAMGILINGADPPFEINSRGSLWAFNPGGTAVTLSAMQSTY